MAKRLIFLDLHFGDERCSLKRKAVANGLREFLRGIKHADELILAGDILDANISSLTLAIEGKKGSESWPNQLGFRDWLAFIFEGQKFKVDRIVYTPSNHDYIIWNILAFVQPISQGLVPTKIPLMEGTFTDPFIQGVAPKWLRDSFIVVYPATNRLIGLLRDNPDIKVVYPTSGFEQTFPCPGILASINLAGPCEGRPNV